MDGNQQIDTYHQPHGFGWLQSVVADNQSILQTMWQGDRK
jgi:hypothetical protein